MNEQLLFKMESGTISSYLKYVNSRWKKEVLYYRRFRESKKFLNNNELIHTFFQPILNLKTGNTIGYETLNRPEQSKFFSTTESFYEFIGQTDQVFLFECFLRNLALKRYIDRLHECDEKNDLMIFVNIHPNVLLDNNYHAGETLQLLKELNIAPEQVVFELTEKSAVTDFCLFEKVLDHYRSQGFRIAIDDVGSGYNSLKTLVYLKPEFIKLDKSLIQYIDQNEEQKQLVSLILEYANRSNTKIIAEGIERIEELAYIQEQGVHYGQGYLLGRPKPDITKGNVPELVL
ncbi:MAG: EAL domain-containing protein [Cytobacillus gottheilii]|uniref:EAL domain-containing protein n=1 Tax=Cytobacillus gottheilii TaxID=859144 RepID=UPI000829B53B|nr:EAL domain-containing protein [Cytobacillus gottheilii]